MKSPGPTITRLILDQLAHGEMRSLRLLVAVRKALGTGPAPFKGDLSAAVNAALRSLVNARTIDHMDGTYWLLPGPKKSSSAGA